MKAEEKAEQARIRREERAADREFSEMLKRKELAQQEENERRPMRPAQGCRTPAGFDAPEACSAKYLRKVFMRFYRRIGTLLVAAALARPGGMRSQQKIYIPVISKGFQHQFWQAVKKGAEAGGRASTTSRSPSRGRPPKPTSSPRYRCS